MTEQQLVKEALQMTERAYAPYSNFHVGAAILGRDGNVYTGCNVESAAFGAGICAERCAVGNAVSRGGTEFEAIAVASDGEELCVPCGVCRQLLYEFAPQMTVICADKTGRFEKYSLCDLLPHAFGKIG